MDLTRKSIEVIKSNQAETGAFGASPNFEPYQYCWFRDGAYCAYALDLWGESEASAKFFSWSAELILSQKDKMETGMQRAWEGESLEEDMILHTRYTLDGRPVEGVPWANFQLDGMGTWLWALKQHLDRSEKTDLDERWMEAVETLRRYLAALWSVPCYDLWEEEARRLHIYTLASIWAGLNAWQGRGNGGAGHDGGQIRQFILNNGLVDGAFVRSIGDPKIDASLLGLALPAEILPGDDPRIVATVRRIEEQLRRGDGVHRNMRDTYYGGGAWLLLSAWLAKYYLDQGQLEQAEPLLAWVEEQAADQGWLPEQVPQNLNDPSFLERWRGFWGEIASPLLWSHAKYLIAKKKQIEID
ncbi:MAG: glycoside hydrolase family 15 protein [Anaerolineales bacterium]